MYRVNDYSSRKIIQDFQGMVTENLLYVLYNTFYIMLICVLANFEQEMSLNSQRYLPLCSHALYERLCEIDIGY